MEGLRGVLEVSWRRLGASWGHLGRCCGPCYTSVLVVSFDDWIDSELVKFVLGKMSKKCRGGPVFWKGFESKNGSKNR